MGDHTAIRFDSILVYQVPFCAPFWSTVTNLTSSGIMRTLWSQLPEECQTSNTAAAIVTCVIAVICIFIHVATIVAYSSLRGDILEEDVGRRKTNLNIIREAADYAFAMKTQERLRMTFAFIGMISGGLMLPIAVASAGAAYSQPFPHSVLKPQESLDQLYNYSMAISALFHLTLSASLCIILLMVIERLRQTLRMCPDHYFENESKKRSGHGTESSPASRRDTGSSRRNNDNKWKRNSDIFLKNIKSKISPIEETFLYAFRQSYTFLDLIMALIVPLFSGVVATLALAVFGARFEPFGSIATNTNQMMSINGLLSYRVGSYPDSVYAYAATIGVVLIALLLGNFISMLRCHTLMSIARYLPGYHHSLDLFKYGEQKKGGRQRPRGFSKIMAPDSVRISKLPHWNRKDNRQDPDGLSIDNFKMEPDFESSLSSIPPPPPPPPAQARQSMMSVDTISLPPPPRPESLVDIPEMPEKYTFPSLPSLIRQDDRIENDPPEEEMATVKAIAFFGTVRQSKVVLATFLSFILLATPLLILFALGVFYPHEGGLAKVMGNPINITNTSVRLESTVLGDSASEGSGYVEPKPSEAYLLTEPVNAVKEVEKEVVYEAALKEMLASAKQKNLITSFSGVSLILYALASVAPFVAYCKASRKFRSEVSRFFCFCLCFQWSNYGKRRKKKRVNEVIRSRSNRIVTMSATSASSYGRSASYEYRSGRDSSSLRRDMRYTTRQANRRQYGPPLRREKTIAGTRNVSWVPDSYGTARM